MLLVVYLLNVFTVFAGIGVLLAYFHVGSAMKRSFGRPAVVGLPLVLGFVWALVSYGGSVNTWTFLGVGLLNAFLVSLVITFVGGWLFSTRLNESEATVGRLGLRPILLTWVGCMAYVVLILGLNNLFVGQTNFWADAAAGHGYAEEHAADAGS